MGEAEPIGLGSSLKFCRIADGGLDVYPRFGPTSEWDTAAGQCVLEGAGGALFDPQGRPFRYNQREGVLNGDFIALAMSPCPGATGSRDPTMTDHSHDHRDIQTLLSIMERLRDPQAGCPWDVEQTFATIAPYTIEEAYEVADAIDRGDLPALQDELGDLLLQVVFHARMAEEQGNFAFGDVVAAISDKMIRRHPHVFAGRAWRMRRHRPSRGKNRSAASANPRVTRTRPRSPASPAACRNGNAR
jgi:NTP pyrophosphatase (non-canonical NTP hydrolase)